MKRFLLIIAALSVSLPAYAEIDEVIDMEADANIGKESPSEPDEEVVCILKEEKIKPALLKTDDNSFTEEREKFKLIETVSLPNGITVEYITGGCRHIEYSFNFKNIPEELKKSYPDLLLISRKLLTMIPIRPEQEKMRERFQKFIGKELVKKRLLAEELIEKQMIDEEKLTEEEIEIKRYEEEDIKTELETDYISASCIEAACTIQRLKKTGDISITSNLAL